MTLRRYLWQQFFSGNDAFTVKTWIRNGSRTLHLHDYFEFIAVTKGRGYICLPTGRATLRIGSVVIIPPGILHSYEKCRRLHMQFCSVRPDFLGKMGLYGPWPPDFFGHPGSDNSPNAVMLHLAPPAQRESKATLEAIERLKDSKNSSALMARTGHLFCFLALLSKVSEKGRSLEVIPPKRMHPLTIRALELMHGSDTTPWTLKSLCERLHDVHPVYFGRIFKRDLMVAPMSYLRRLRCQQAAQMLSHSAMAISEVAYRLGWDDPNLFTRTFHRELGLTPSAYRVKSGPRLLRQHRQPSQVRTNKR